jgi:hypothetical protein
MSWKAPTSWEDIPLDTYFTYTDLYRQQVERVRDGATFVEVGSFLGRSSAFMAQAIKESGKHVAFYCVDTWDGVTQPDFCQAHQDEILRGLGLDREELYDAWLSNMIGCGTIPGPIPLRMSSLEGARKFLPHELDFVFIDAAHDYESVLADLHAWYNKVAAGGVIAGHDYKNEHAGVDRAVTEFFGELPKRDDQCWVVERT